MQSLLYAAASNTCSRNVPEISSWGFLGLTAHSICCRVEVQRALDVYDECR